MNNPKHLGLKRSTHRKNVRSYIDQDYVHKLSDGEKEYLSRFNNEYYKCFFERGTASVHKTEHKKSIFASNNARNRDAYGVCEGINQLVPINEELLVNPEEAINELIDKKEELLPPESTGEQLLPPEPTKEEINKKLEQVEKEVVDVLNKSLFTAFLKA